MNSLVPAHLPGMCLGSTTDQHDCTLFVRPCWESSFLARTVLPPGPESPNVLQGPDKHPTASFPTPSGGLGFIQGSSTWRGWCAWWGTRSCSILSLNKVALSCQPSGLVSDESFDPQGHHLPTAQLPSDGQTRPGQAMWSLRPHPSEHLQTVLLLIPDQRASWTRARAHAWTRCLLTIRGGGWTQWARV